MNRQEARAYLANENTNHDERGRFSSVDANGVHTMNPQAIRESAKQYTVTPSKHPAWTAIKKMFSQGGDTEGFPEQADSEEHLKEILADKYQVNPLLFSWKESKDNGAL